MIWWKHSYENGQEVVSPVGQSTSELATHAISRLLGEENQQVAYGISMFDHGRARPSEVARMLHYLENSAAESGRPWSKDTVDYVAGKNRC